MRKELKSMCHERFKDILEIVQPGWIAGGALRDFFAMMPQSSDIDVFFHSKEEFTTASTKSKELYDREHVQGFMFKNRHVQLIKNHFFEGPEETIAQFDFTVCCVAIQADGEIFHHEHFFDDLCGRRLAINSMPFPLSTLERLQKYVAKGFLACNGTLLQISTGIQSVDLKNPDANTLTFYPNRTPRFARFD